MTDPNDCNCPQALRLQAELEARSSVALDHGETETRVVMPRRKRRPCIMGKRCAEHGGEVHGREAEELRRALEALLRSGDVTETSVMRILERVDARDSLAYLEAQDDD
jgi:hypothetical protein